MRARSLTAVLVLLAAWPAGASASSAVLLPEIGGDDAVSPEARAAARELARQVLDAEGWRVFDAAEVAAHLPEPLAGCGPGEGCAFEVRAVLGADVAVGLSLEGSGDAIERVTVSITGARGVVHRAGAGVDPEAGLPFAVAEPLREALAIWATGNVTEPPPPRPTPHVELTPAMRVEPSPVNWFLGGFLLLGSAPLLGYGINSAVRDGECVTPGIGETCMERIRFREGAGIFTGLGAALLVAGVVVLVAQPVPMFVRIDGESASLELRGTF